MISLTLHVFKLCTCFISKMASRKKTLNKLLFFYIFSFSIFLKVKSTSGKYLLMQIAVKYVRYLCLNVIPLQTNPQSYSRLLFNKIALKITIWKHIQQIDTVLRTFVLTQCWKLLLSWQVFETIEKSSFQLSKDFVEFCHIAVLNIFTHICVLTNFSMSYSFRNIVICKNIFWR